MDYLGLSFYPYLSAPWWKGNGNPESLTDDWLNRVIEYADGLPIAVCETAYIAETCRIDVLGWDIKGTPEWQNDYVSKLLSELNNLNCEFVIWWTIADFDKLLSVFPEEIKYIGRIWRDTGLFDNELKPRPALSTWDHWLDRSFIIDVQ